MENNFHYTVELCLAALEAGARFITASSASTYGGGELGFSDNLELMPRLRPLNMYGYSKQMFDLWAKRRGYLAKITGCKFSNVYGPNERHKGEMRSVVCRAFEQMNITKAV